MMDELRRPRHRFHDGGNRNTCNTGKGNEAIRNREIWNSLHTIYPCIVEYSLYTL